MTLVLNRSGLLLEGSNPQKIEDVHRLNARPPFTPRLAQDAHQPVRKGKRKGVSGMFLL